MENIIPLVLDANFETGELFRHVKQIDDCMRILDNSGDEKLAGEEFTNETMKGGSGSPLSGALSYKQVGVAVLHRQMAMSSFRGVFFRP